MTTKRSNLVYKTLKEQNKKSKEVNKKKQKLLKLLKDRLISVNSVMRIRRALKRHRKTSLHDHSVFTFCTKHKDKKKRNFLMTGKRSLQKTAKLLNIF